MKKNKGDSNSGNQLVAQVSDARLYTNDLKGIVPNKTTADDSTTRVNAYINSWVRKQLLIKEALKTISIDETEIERQVQDYRYSLITYRFLKYYTQQHTTDTVSKASIEKYYRDHADNFILKQNIIQGSYIKLPKDAPNTKRIKELMFSTKKKDLMELKSYCLGFSSAFHLADSTWIEFDKIAVNSPLMDIPSKIHFLQSNNYYETSDANFLYFLKIDAYKIIDNVSPLDFVNEQIKNTILNKRKVELAKKLEDEIYEKAATKKEFEIFSK